MIPWILFGVSIAGCMVLGVLLTRALHRSPDALAQERIKFLEHRLRWEKKLSRLEEELIAPRE